MNLAQTGADVANELRGKTWDQRFQWVSEVKEQGNKFFKLDLHDNAIDTYMKALCGMDFSSYDLLPSVKDQKERDLRVSRDLKAPVLNNIALCLTK